MLKACAVPGAAPAGVAAAAAAVPPPPQSPQNHQPVASLPRSLQGRRSGSLSPSRSPSRVRFEEAEASWAHQLDDLTAASRLPAAAVAAPRSFMPPSPEAPEEPPKRLNLERP